MSEESKQDIMNFFFFNDTATTEIYTLSLHDALPIWKLGDVMQESAQAAMSYIRSRAHQFGLPRDFYRNLDVHIHIPEGAIDRKSTRLNSSHANISYAVFCLKKKI